MRIYEGSPRQGWEEVFRSIGAYVDRERIKELLLLELDAGFILQGMAVPAAGARTESEMTLVKITRELPDDEVAELSQGRALRTNIGLIVGNARMAARIAVALADDPSHRPA